MSSGAWSRRSSSPAWPCSLWPWSASIRPSRPPLGGIIGNPFYGPGLLLGGYSPGVADSWWSVTGAGLRTGTYFLFETAFASVTLALVGVVALHKMKLSAFAIYSVVYLALIWALPAAWIWNPSGWLAKLGMVDFAGGLVVHGAAGAAGFGIVWQIWREERAKGYKQSPPVHYRVNAGWLTIAILLLWVGWFGFNPGSVPHSMTRRSLWWKRPLSPPRWRWSLPP